MKRRVSDYGDRVADEQWNPWDYQIWLSPGIYTDGCGDLSRDEIAAQLRADRAESLAIARWREERGEDDDDWASWGPFGT